MSGKPNSIKKMTGALVDDTRKRVLQSLSLCFGDAIIKVRSDSPRLLEILGAYYEGFVCAGHGSPDMEVIALEQDPPRLTGDFVIKEPDPGKTKIKEEYADFHDGRVVRKRLTGMLFWFGGGANVAVGPCVENANQVINFINNRYIQWMLNRGYILGHASAVGIGSCAIALAGIAGAGKSTLALHLMGKGGIFISNDRLLIKKEADYLSLSGVAKLPRVNPGTILNNPLLEAVMPPGDRAACAALPARELWDLEQKYDVFINAVFGKGRFTLFGTLDALVILTWQRNNGPFKLAEVDISRRRDLLGAFIKSPGLFYEPEISDPEKAFSEDAYIDHLKLCRVFEISGGVDFEKAAAACMSLAGAGLNVRSEA